MKIIFLDIDGVLNSEKSAEYYCEEYGATVFNQNIKKDAPTIQEVRWGAWNVFFLRKIIKETGAKVVLSSTWRTRYDIATFGKFFALYDFSDIEIIGITPKLPHRERGNEIAQFLDNFQYQSRFSDEITQYVILDDDNDMLESQKDYFVQTDFDFGLTEKDALKAIKILNNN